MQTYLDFEKGLAEIEGKAEELRAMGRKNSEMKVDEEAHNLIRNDSRALIQTDGQKIIDDYWALVG